MRTLLWLSLFLMACVPARRRVRGDIARNIRFTGNAGLLSGHNNLQLRSAMEQESTRFGLMVWPLKYVVDPAPYVAENLARDAYRIEVFYAHRGWMDAKVVGWQTRQVRRVRKRKAGIVDIRGYVEPGPPSLIRAYEVTGLTPTTQGYGRNVKRVGPIKVGRQFALASAELARAQLEQDLQKHGYAYADVELAMSADPTERAVDIELEADPGIITRYGEISISGNKAIKLKFIEQNLRLSSGTPYRLDELIQAQNRLFAMGTFSLVTVTPDLSDPTSPTVPIRVKVTENRFRSIRFGVGLRTEGINNWEPNIQSRFRHAHLLHQLIRWEVFGRVGLSGYSPNPRVDTIVYPIWTFSTSLTYPRILGQRVAQQVEVKVQRGLDQGIARFDNPELDIRTIYKPNETLLIRMGPHLEIFEYVDKDAFVERVAQRLFGEGFDGSYQLVSLDTGLTLDWRDDKLTTRRGSFFNTTLRYAFPLSSDGFHFLSGTGDWRLFRPIRIGDDVPMTFATRIHGKVLFPFGDSGIPYPEKAFLGGANSMRGFPSRGLGPYQTLVVGEGQRYFLPEGGTLSLVLSEELRYYGSYGVTYAAFVDAATLADVWDINGDGTGAGQSLIDGFRVAGGVGLRYGSPIGPLRLDFAVRPNYPEDFCPNVDACQPGDRRQRRLDVVRTFDADSRWPGFMLFFAFGEAI